MTDLADLQVLLQEQPEVLAEVLRAFEEDARWRRQTRLYRMFPDEGPLRRGLYPKHLEFFRAGAEHQERAFIAGNRTGKSFAVCYELTCHLVGWYPEWWEGRRFDRPVVAWAAGEDAKAVRESLQETLLGRPGELGTGLIPGDRILNTTARSGTPEAVDSVTVAHVQGVSRLVLKCFVAGTRVRMAAGDWRPIETLCLGDVVTCADGLARRIIATYAYADAPTLRFRLRSGALCLTPNHELFLEDGRRVEASRIKVGDVLQAAAGWHETTPQEAWRVRLTALMIGDGCTRAKTPFFTCNEPEIVDEVRRALPLGYRVVPVANTISYKIAGDDHKFNVLKHSLEADGLWGKKAKDKFIPGWVFRLGREQKLTFLRWLWGCDGTINEKSATYVTASEVLANDVRLLLWDFGIFVEVKCHYVGLRGKRFRSFYVTLTGENRLKFTEIGKLNRDVACEITPRPNGPYHEVLEITEGGRQDVYCITVEGEHEFIAEGYRSGNSYDQGRESFQASKVDVVVLDEEPPMAIYTEALTRTLSTVPGERSGLVLCAFTPLKGLSAVVLSFLPSGKLAPT